MLSFGGFCFPGLNQVLYQGFHNLILGSSQ
jgi:hypothetical protein